MSVIKPDIPVPPINTAGTVEAQNQAGETKGPLVNAGDPVKDAQSNDVEIKKEQIAAAADKEKADKEALNKSALPAGAKSDHPDLVAPGPKSLDASSEAAKHQSGSVGVLIGKMKSESEAIHEKIEMALRDHDLQENNIPLSHPYWGWLNEYRMLRGQNR